jgi:hypothetical protein
VFNVDAINNVELIKAGIPAKYGGRLSSVLNVNTNVGDNQEFGVRGGVGLISSRLTLDGPIKKDKGSFLISGRRTYLDVVTKPFIPEDGNFSGTGYYFYDLNVEWIINYLQRIRFTSAVIMERMILHFLLEVKISVLICHGEMG